MSGRLAVRWGVGLPLLLALAFTAGAQPFTNGAFVLANGGGTVSGGPFQSVGTIGQSLAHGPLTGGVFAESGGFWSRTRRPATILLGPLSVAYDGNPKPVGVTTVPAGLAVNVTYNGATAAPSAPGTYVVVATVTDPNFTGTTTGNLNIQGAAPTVSAPNVVTNHGVGMCGQWVAFAPITTGSPAPVVTYRWNGQAVVSPALLPGGTNLITCTASNLLGARSTNFTVVISNAPPVAGANTLATTPGQAVSVPAAKVLLHDAAVSGGVLSLTGVAPVSLNGGAVTLASGLITYAPAANFTGTDLINYTLSDGCATAPGAIVVTVAAANQPAQNVIAITRGGAGTTLLFAGIPGFRYQVQYAAILGGVWSNLGAPITATATGLIQTQDNTIPPPATRFYRTQVVP